MHRIRQPGPGNLVYVCDAQTSYIKILTTLNNTARFLRALGAPYSAFSVHEKHDEYSLYNLPTAISNVVDFLCALEENVSSIKNMEYRPYHGLSLMALNCKKVLLRRLWTL